MADNNKATTTTTQPELSKELTELLREFISTSRNLYPKKATKRTILRSLATLKAVIVDIEEEVAK